MAAITHGDVGDTWTPQATFTVAGVATDPTNITVKVRDAAGTITTLGPVAGATGGGGITRVSAGVFKTDVAITAAGYWTANFTGTGAAAASEDQEFIADPSAFSSNYGLTTRALVGVQETKDWLQRQNVDTSADLDLVRVINDISDRIIEESGGREFKAWATNPATRTFTVENIGRRMPLYIDGQWMGDRDANNRRIQVGDLTSFTAVSILDSTDWTTVVESVTPLTKVEAHPLVRMPWEPIRELELRSDVAALVDGMRISVTGVWGFPSVPGNIRQATLDAVAATLDRDVEHYRADLSPQSGSESGVLVVTQKPLFLSLPPAVLAVAWSYRDAPSVG